MNRKSGFSNPIMNWDHDRLKYRFYLFENICLPSLIGQKYKKNYKVIIMISNDLPNIFKKRLRYLLKHYNYIHIVPIDNIRWNSGEFLKKYCPNNTNTVITTRLDDDDALNLYFTKYVYKHINKHQELDYILSFPYGNYLNIDRKNKKIGYAINSGRLIACGLTRVRTYDGQGTAYCGNHKKLDGKFHIIYDNRPNMYIVTNHNFNDSRRSYMMINLNNNKDLDGNFLRLFPFIDKNKLLEDKLL